MKAPDFTKLTRNPLGIIGLFIWLIYSIAGIVFATSVSELNYSIQLILTLFVVLFPPVILFVFYLLVTKHHNKLYAPGDFKDERLFFRSATHDEVKAKQDKEESAINKSSVPVKEHQRATVNTTSTGYLSYIAIEAAALNWLEDSYGHIIPRNCVTEIDGRKYMFDGVHQDTDHLDLFEVKIYRRPVFKREFIEAVMYRAASLFLHDSISIRARKFCLWLVIVTDFEGDALNEFSQQMENSVDTNNFDVKWKFVPKSQLSLEDIR